jgi:ABC-type phosphate transport system substrate-binding protein
MRSFTSRRSLAACALSVATAAALAAPGVASAKKVVPATCGGSNIIAAGSTLQKTAVKSVWGPAFDTSKNTSACGGTQKPTITYESIGSGEGLEKFGYNGHAFEAGTVAIVATDEPVNQEQKAEIEGHQTKSAPESVESIPVLQAAVAILVNLPANCTAESTAYPAPKGRLVFNNVTLEKIYKGEINNWSELTEDGDKLVGASCVATTPFTRLVRLDESGTTHILKKYLNLIDDTPLKTSLGDLTWNEMSEGTNNNEAWPEAAHVKAAKATGGGALVTEVANTPSSIGYASLADSRANGGFSKTGVGGGGTGKFWAPIQNNGVVDGKRAQTFSDPATNGDVEETANSNCALTKYTNGKGTKFPPTSVTDTWNEVTTNTKEKNYPICGITYDTVFTSYSAYPGTNAAEVETASQFLKFELNTNPEGGQQLILGTDYEPLPAKLQKESLKGAELTKY